MPLPYARPSATRPCLSRMLPAAALAGLLAGCAAPPSSTILSRLSDSQPGAVGSQARTLSPAERARYDAIDREVLREQDRVLADEAAARAYAYSAYPYSPPVTVYGSYYGGWHHRGWGAGVGYGYPGWGWGW
ncbi:MAG: hypothetical protein GAK40_00492 [Burkholderia plantarii]|nr:MAG: hypothetical protein GAK40_00492 [Burkholderia plantarii]